MRQKCLYVVMEPLWRGVAISQKMSMLNEHVPEVSSASKFYHTFWSTTGHQIPNGKAKAQTVHELLTKITWTPFFGTPCTFNIDSF